MKISLNQLRRLIRETIEEVEAIDVVVSPEEFEAIITEAGTPASARYENPPSSHEPLISQYMSGKLKLPELPPDVALLTIGQVIGTLVPQLQSTGRNYSHTYMTVKMKQALRDGFAAKQAQMLADEMSAKAKADLIAKAAEARENNLQDAVISLADDMKLGNMFQQLRDLKETGTSKEITALSKQITAYVKANMKKTGADPMDVRKRLGTRWNY